MTILVTGAAGFIGSNFVLDWLGSEDENIVSLDNLTYAGNLDNLASLSKDSRHFFVKGDIGDTEYIFSALKKYKPRAIINFAAETHVDNSISEPINFIETNILGTYKLLENTLLYWKKLEVKQKNDFRFIHISTDEVYGALDKAENPATERNRYMPNNPYSASKAASDHLLRAWYQTYNLPVITTNCSNNFGPFQFPEKLIPLCIFNAINNKPLPLYGDGKQVRDWVYVSDHCDAIRKVLKNGGLGETYNIGGNSERTNIEVVQMICNLLDDIKPMKNKSSYAKLISFVKDRPGHDQRYAIDSSKIQKELGWQPKVKFELGMEKTVRWYLGHDEWVKNIIKSQNKEVK
jgi:dTDP-glucose 4,6-dehydratase|tara:strand:+ start:273 stop:1316 length:1044 start_codon:yes stop_codon:yes gene_type:complete